MKCKVCGQEAILKFRSIILKKYDANYFYCKNCNFLFVNEPFWLEESYRNPINLSDTGLVNRNLCFSRLVAVIIYFFFNKGGKFLDYSGGYGLFTRLMRDIGFDFYWNDPYCTNILAKGFEYDPNSNERIELTTAFEVLEHLSGTNEIEKMLKISRNLIFTTELLPSPIPEPSQWWYYGLEHGQHIAFYSKNSLEYLAKANKLNFYSVGGLHIFTEKTINKAVLYLLLKLSKLDVFNFMKRNMMSKTQSDNLYIKANLY